VTGPTTAAAAGSAAPGDRAAVAPLRRPDYRPHLRPGPILRWLGPRGAWRVLRRERRGGRPELYRLRPRGALHALEVRAGTSDWYSLHQVFVERPYDAAAIGRPRSVVDAGAYVGYVSAFLLARDPDCRVAALEPGAANFERLRANLAPFGDRARAERLALWPRAARLRVLDPPAGRRQEWGTQVREPDAGEPGEVEGLDPGALLDRLGLERADLLKIDVEGAEAPLFARGVEGWIGRFGAVAVELHGESAERALADAFPTASFEHTRAGEMTLLRIRR
jgi:FkbM family methyltransferase